MSLNLHQLFYGIQDDYISKMSQHKFIGTFVETRTIFLEGNTKKKTKVIFSNSEDTKRDYGYTNMRFNGDYNQTQSITLKFGDLIFDRIYPSITKKLSTFPIMDGNILPAFKQHEGQILIEHSGDVEILYDVMTINNPLKENNVREFLYDFTQFTGIEEVSGSIAKVRLSFNHPTKKITVITDNPISAPIMYLFTSHDGCPLTLLDNGHNWTYEYIFDQSVNFSEIYSAFIVCNLEKETVMAIFGQSVNVATFKQDMIGIKFED